MSDLIDNWPFAGAFLVMFGLFVGYLRVNLKYMQHRDELFASTIRKQSEQSHVTQRDTIRVVAESTAAMSKLTSVIDTHDTSVREMRQVLERLRPS